MQGWERILISEGGAITTMEAYMYRFCGYVRARENENDGERKEGFGERERKRWKTSIIIKHG